MLPQDMYLTSLFSRRDLAAVGIDVTDRRQQIPMSRIDVIISKSGRGVTIHYDPNALGSVQLTAEVGFWKDARFVAHLGRRQLKARFKKKKEKKQQKKKKEKQKK